MSVMHSPHQPSDERPAAPREHGRPRDDVDHDLVAILGMVAILALTALCFLGRTALPF